MKYIYKIMLYLFKFLFLLRNINQEIILNWFGVEKIDIQTYSKDNVNVLNLISIQTLKLIITGIWGKFHDGLTLTDIETFLFFILFVRFIILILRYNLKTSFYITCIGMFAGYLWYRHLIDLISLYRSILVQLPYLNKLGIDAIQLRIMNREMVLNNLKLGDNVHWYQPGQLIYYGLLKGIIKTNIDTGYRYYIDPVSMIVTTLPDSIKENIVPVYYKIYNKFIPQAFEAISKFWNQLSGIAAYAVITRIGKRYCPYLVRWHWTFLLIIGFIEQILIYFIFRISYFQSTILIPQTQVSNNYIDETLILQINLLNGLVTLIISMHLALIFFGLFHAIWGQYFYFPFLVENTELHIGSRPTNSIYSGGNTAWQEKKVKNTQQFFPQFWYGWFGGGVTTKKKFLLSIKQIVYRFFRRILK